MIKIIKKKYKPRIKARLRKMGLKKKLKPRIKARIRKNRQLINKNVDNFFDWIKGAELVELKKCNISEDPVRPELNNKFRNKNKTTDVLSFSSERKLDVKKSTYIGDIVISYEFMNKPKTLSTLEFKNKVTKIFIHGFLHLLGHDHIKLKDFKKNKITLKKRKIKLFHQ